VESYVLAFTQIKKVCPNAESEYFICDFELALVASVKQMALVENTPPITRGVFKFF
jgi:hypothetical protein